MTSDLESDDGEKDEVILPTNVDQMIDVCRKAAEVMINAIVYLVICYYSQKLLLRKANLENHR